MNSKSRSHFLLVLALYFFTSSFDVPQASTAPAQKETVSGGHPSISADASTVVYLPLVLKNYFKPLPPVLISPTDNASVRGSTTLTWAASSGASKYQLHFYSSGGDWGTPEQTGLSYFFFETGTISWTVRAGDAIGNWSDWSPSRTLTVLPAAFSSGPTLVSPADGTTIHSGRPTFSWNYLPHEGGIIYGSDIYQVQVDDNANFSSPIYDDDSSGEISRKMLAIDYIIPGSTWPVYLILPNGSFYWRVRARNTVGEHSPWSATRSFQLIKTYADCETLKSGPDTYYIGMNPLAGWPMVSQVDISNLTPTTGETQTVTIYASVIPPADPNQSSDPIQSVTARFVHDNGVTNPVTFTLIAGDTLQGQWQGQWVVPGTVCYNYGYIIAVTNAIGTRPLELQFR
jgi:hypothetical protein